MREINLENFRRMLNELNMACKCDKCVEYLTVLTQEKANEVLNTIIKKAYDEKLQGILEFRKLGKLLLDIPMEITQEDEDFVNKLIDEELERLDSLYDIFNKDNTEMSGQEFANVSFNSYKENQSSEIFIDKCQSIKSLRRLIVKRNDEVVYMKSVPYNSDTINNICEELLISILPSNEKFQYGFDILPENEEGTYYYTAPVLDKAGKVIKYLIEVKYDDSMTSMIETAPTCNEDCDSYIVVVRDNNGNINTLVLNIPKTINALKTINDLTLNSTIDEIIESVKINTKTEGVIANMTFNGPVDYVLNLK